MLFINQELTDLLKRSGMEQTVSVRQLVLNLAGERNLDEYMRMLFVNHETLRIVWDDEEGSTFQVVVQPIIEGEKRGQHLGYVAFFDDLTPMLRLKEIRSTLVAFASSRVRNTLMVIMGYAGMLRDKVPTAEDRDMLADIGERAQEVAAALDRLKSVGMLEEHADRSVEVNFAQIVREAVGNVRGDARDRDLRVQWHLPEFSLPVDVAPMPARDALTQLLRHACVSAPIGGTLRVRLAEHPERTDVQLSWPGTGLDPELLELLEGDWHTRPERLPEVLHPFARARSTFADLSVDSAPGRGVKIEFSLPRSASAPAPSGVA